MRKGIIYFSLKEDFIEIHTSKNLFFLNGYKCILVCINKSMNQISQYICLTFINLFLLFFVFNGTELSQELLFQ